MSCASPPLFYSTHRPTSFVTAVFFFFFDRRSPPRSVSCAQVTWYLFHWLKGNPLSGGNVTDQDKWNRLTVWEQLDNEFQFTHTRKVSCHTPPSPPLCRCRRRLSLPRPLLPLTPFLTRQLFTIIPIVLFIITTHSAGAENLVLFVPNLVALSILLISKMPAMHGVRLFGVNAGPN